MEDVEGRGSVGPDEVLDAISHPSRIRMLKALARNPLSFSELKHVLGVESSGAVDFHLKKMGVLLNIDANGKYTLNAKGYAALEAVNTIERYGWQRRAFYINVGACILMSAWVLANLLLWDTTPMEKILLLLVLLVSTAWMVFYAYWSIKRRKIFEWKKEDVLARSLR